MCLLTTSCSWRLTQVYSNKPFENQVSKKLGQTSLPRLSISFHPLMPYFLRIYQLFLLMCLWTIILFVPKQHFPACKQFRPLYDTTITPATLWTTYLSFLIPYFRPLQGLDMLSQIVAHCCNCFWFWKNPSKRGCRHGRHKNFSITIFWV